MMRMAFFFPRERIENELKSLTHHLKERRMDDDASFALLTDKRDAGQVLIQLEPQYREMLFGLPPDQSKKVLHNYVKALDIMAQKPCATSSEIARENNWKKDKVREKLDGFIYTGVIAYRDGKYYF